MSEGTDSIAYLLLAVSPYKLRIDDCLPEPFVGNPEAPMAVLGNNPGFRPERPNYKLEPRFTKRMRANLLHLPSDSPFI
jgi:hypothetical protein